MRILLILSLLLAPLAQADNLLNRLPSLGGSTQPEFLPPDQAFGLDVQVGDAQTLLANFKVVPTYYLYRDKVKIVIKSGAAKIRTIKLPQGDLKNDPNFGEMMVFHKSFQAEVLLVNTSSSTQNITLEATYQGCSENGLCYPPIVKAIKLKLPVPVAAVATVAEKSPTTLQEPEKTAASTPSTADSTSAPDNESSQIAQLFKKGNYLLIISAFLGFGLLLAFTPCVFPMIPILSGIIVGRGSNITKMNAFILSMAYVQGMALTYARYCQMRCKPRQCWAVSLQYLCCFPFPCSASMNCNYPRPCKVN
jgi:thiol:disulfide interchange protein DsbD